MTSSPSPPLSPKSSSSSRPSSSTSNSAIHDTDTPRSFFQSGLPPVQHFTTAPTAGMGIAGPSRAPNTPDDYASPPERLILSRQKSDESIRPSSSTSSPQALEDAVIGIDPDAGAASSPSGEPAPSRQKRKRTRTLTTPHQSAVLHALLAQSRFPTTAMREEVGRSIGLSARKVQVWFQNQRQKARKPRNQSTMPLNHPPQFGPFQSGAQETVPFTGSSSSSTQFQGGDNPSDMLPQQTYTSEYQAASVHPSGLPAPYLGLPQYSLSGVSSSQNPSVLPQTYQYSSVGPNLDRGPSSIARGSSSPFAFAPPPSQSPFPPDPFDRRHSVSGPAMTRGSEPPIVLPPLRFEQPRGSQTLPPLPTHHDPYRSPDIPRSSSPTAHSSSTSSMSKSTGSHFPSSLTLPPPPSRHSGSIPPPFTLQPPPQWDSSNPIPGPTPTIPPPVGLTPSSHGPVAARPRLHRTNSDPTRRLPPLSMVLEQEPSRDPLLLTQPWTRRNLSSTVALGGRRFDPVHSVLHERGVGVLRVEDEGSTSMRRNRHTYDFSRPSRSVVTPSPPPNPDDTHGEYRQSDHARE